MAIIFQIKVTLDNYEPPIWRKLLVSGDTNLAQLHHIIQGAMGWTNSHLHMFIVGKVRFSIAYDDVHLIELVAIDSQHVALQNIVLRPGFDFIYEYDFGDSWKHTVLVEEILPPDSKQKLPVCIDGERACPPEDIGGVWGYGTFLETIADSKHPEHQELKEWYGDSFDPEAFDLDLANTRLSQKR